MANPVESSKRDAKSAAPGSHGDVSALSSGLQLVPARPRARDLLKLTDFPIHPFDQAHGTNTSGLVPAQHLRTGSPSDEHVTAYYGVAPSILRSLVQRWQASEPAVPIEQWTFIDIGCGKGRAMLVASELGFRRVVGVELNPGLAEVARRNIAHWTAAHSSDPTASRLSAMELLEQDALELELPRGPVLLFLFHPFEAPVLAQLLDSLDAQMAVRRKPHLDVLYVNAECCSTFEQREHYNRLFLSSVAMTPEDYAADLEAIAQQREYGSTGDEECAIFRYSRK
jgi:SAM-dependent methyltransferase